MRTALPVSFDTKRFEVAAVLDVQGRLRSDVARQAIDVLDRYGFVVVNDVLSGAEAEQGLGFVKSLFADQQRERAEFASQIDTRYGRRDFCPLPSNEPVLALASQLCARLQEVLGEYCGRSRRVLEISTLTSYHGSSHQYVHRDSAGVLCMFAALDHVSENQGGTLFVPGTHTSSGSDLALEGRAEPLASLLETRSNARILVHNLKNILRLWRAGEISDRELRWRTFSHHHDNHQPNLLNFLLARCGVFNIKHLDPATLLGLMRHRRALDEHFEMVQVCPKRGSVILYRTEILHAGPDNQSERPRYIVAVNIARDLVNEGYWLDRYAPHSTLESHPLSLADLVSMGASQAAGLAQESHGGAI